MRKNLYFIILSCSLVSCYTYQVKKTKPVEAAADNQSKAVKPVDQADPVRLKKNSAGIQNQNIQQVSAPVSIEEKLAANKNVKIEVDGKSYKVIVDRWESDSLVVHPVHNPKKILKFHKNQINAERIAEKRFSQPIADIITVVVYAGIGAGIWALLN